MTEQIEALRLADGLDDIHTTHVARNAAAELRRQHALLQEWKAKAATWLASPEAAQRLDGYRELSQRANRAEAQRDALLEFAKYVDAIDPGNPAPLFERARAAIKQAEGEKA